MILFSPKLFSSSNYIWNVLHAIENVTSSCRPLRSLCGTAMGFIKAGLLLGISTAAKGGLRWNTFCYKCWTLVLVVGDLSQRHSAHQIILKTKAWIIGQELLRYVLFLPFCPKALMEGNVVVLVCTGVMAEICAADVFLSPRFPGAVFEVPTGYKQVCSGFPASTQSWVMEQLWLSQWIRIRDTVQGNGWGAIAAEILQFLLAARLCEQWSGFGKVLSPCYIHIGFLASLPSSLMLLYKPVCAEDLVALALEFPFLSLLRSCLWAHCKSHGGTQGVNRIIAWNQDFMTWKVVLETWFVLLLTWCPALRAEPAEGKSHIWTLCITGLSIFFFFHTNAKRNFIYTFPVWRKRKTIFFW